MDRKEDDMYFKRAGIRVDPKKPGPANLTVRCFIRKDKESSYYTLWQHPPLDEDWTVEGVAFPFCRICYGDDELKNLLTPCSCSGTMKYVHGGCLERWCTAKGVAIGVAICDICHQLYRMQVNDAVKRGRGKFLLEARQVRHFKSTEYIISSKLGNRSKGSDINTVGVLESDFLNTKFAIYDVAHTGTQTSSNKVSPGLHARKCKVADIEYQFYSRSPGRFSKGMECSLLTIPASVMDINVSALTATESSTTSCHKDDSIPFGVDLESTIQNCHAGQFQSSSTPLSKIERPLVLKCQGRWNMMVNEWIWFFPCHQFKNISLYDRHNGKLVATARKPNKTSSQVLLRFGKVGKDPIGNDLYLLHYSYPLSAFQAFAMFLSSCDSRRLAESSQGWTTNPTVWLAPPAMKKTATE